MKICPRCNQKYPDDNLNFCLNDGEMLRDFDDAPPTIMMDAPRVTNQTNWQQQSQYQPPPAEPIAPWQNQQPTFQPNQSYGLSQINRSPDQTLPTISLVLGIAGLVMFCCYGGIWLGIPAAVVGYLGMKNADNDSAAYGGRGLAIGGMVLGVISLLLTVGMFFLGLLGSIFS